VPEDKTVARIGGQLNGYQLVSVLFDVVQEVAVKFQVAVSVEMCVVSQLGTYEVTMNKCVQLLGSNFLRCSQVVPLKPRGQLHA
jgi:hypothetical protein